MAIIIGDMPPPLLAVEGARGPRGPFCIPLRTSIKPIFASIGACCPSFAGFAPGFSRLLPKTPKEVWLNLPVPSHSQSLPSHHGSLTPEFRHDSTKGE